MSPARRLGASALLALTALALGPAAAPARAWTHFYAGSPCNSNPVRLGGHRAMIPRCASGSLVSLTTGVFADEAEAAWREWWDLSRVNFAVWMRRDLCNGATPVGLCDGINSARSGPSTPSTGWAWSSCAVNGTPYIDEVDAEVQSSRPVSVTRCSHGTAAYSGTWIHEYGHNYGFDHFDDWLSSMNTNTPDISSCLPNRLSRPSSDAQQGYGALYGMPAAYDYGTSPIFQTGSLVMGGGWAIGDSTTTFAASATSASVTVSFTRMNMRNAWPNATLFFRIYLSTDAVKSFDDMLVGEHSWNSGLFAGAIYPEHRVVTFNPSLYLVAGGPIKCFLVEVDTSLTVSEVREDDNVMDTRICVRRNAT